MQQIYKTRKPQKRTARHDVAATDLRPMTSIAGGGADGAAVEELLAEIDALLAGASSC